MAETINVAKYYKVEYECSGWFAGCSTWKFERLMDTLNIKCEEVNNDEWDIDTESVDVAIDNLERIIIGEETEINDEQLDDCLAEVQMTIHELEMFLCWLVSAADKDNDFIHVAFF